MNLVLWSVAVRVTDEAGEHPDVVLDVCLMAETIDEAKRRAPLLARERVRFVRRIPRPRDDSWEEFIVDALAAAGLLAAPSHLDRLAAWAEGASGRELAITTEDPQPEIKWLIEACPAGVKPLDGDVVEFDSDIQEAARRVLARLEES